MFELAKPNKNDYLDCDICKSPVYYHIDNLYHHTVVINGELNTHAHLCHRCFTDKVKTVPIISG